MYTLNDMVPFFVDAGEAKAKKPLISQILLGIFAGGLIGLGYIAFLAAIQTFPGTTGIFIGAMMFPMALLSILVLGGELITSNAMIVGLAYFHKKISIKELLTNWIVVFFSNVIGAVSIALVINYLGIFDGIQKNVFDIVTLKLSLSYGQLVVSGTLCSIFVGIAAWMFNASKGSTLKVATMWLPIAVFALVGFQHCIANAVVYSIALLWGQIDLLPVVINVSFTIIGNILGGLVFVGLLLDTVNKANSKKTK